MTMDLSSTKLDFYRILENIAQTHGMTNYEISFGKKPLRAGGHIAKITEAQIVTKNQKYNLIIKYCDSDDKIRSAMPIQLLFTREIYMYTSIFPLFASFEVEHGAVPSDFAATYYNSYKGNHQDALVLHNLKIDGFSIYDTKSFLDQRHTLLIINKYAHFHAISLTYRNQYPLKFKTLSESLENFSPAFYRDGGIIGLLIKQMEMAGTSLNSQDNVETKHIYENFLNELEHFLVGLPSAADEYSAIIHGDCWKNNFMFKHGDSTDPLKPTDLRLIDFQMSTLGSPMLDIANFFYACATSELVDNVEAYLDIYYTNLSKHVQDLGSDPEQVYPKSVMVDHWKKFARIGLIIRLSALRLLYSDEKGHKGISDLLEDDGDLSNVFDYEITDIEKYNEQSRHAIFHFVNNQLI